MRGTVIHPSHLGTLPARTLQEFVNHFPDDGFPITGEMVNAAKALRATKQK